MVCVGQATAAELAFASDRSGRNQVWTVKTEDPANTLNQVTTAGSGAQESRAPDWSFTGGIAYQFGASGVRGIYRINANGTNNLQLTDFLSDERDPSWSPDGRFVVYARLVGTDYDLWIHDIGNDPTITEDDQDYILLYRPGSSEQRPVWSPNGQRIAFVTNGGVVGPDAEIAVVDVQVDPVTKVVTFVPDADGNPKGVVLTNNSYIDFDPTWSPDSQRIAYSSTRNGTRDIFRMSAKYGECVDEATTPQACWSFVQLTTHGAEDRNPAWSPDGRLIAFVSERDGNREIYLMSAIAGEADTANLQRITNHSASDDDPSWSPVLPAPPSLNVQVTIPPVSSGTPQAAQGIVKVFDYLGQPVPSANVTILGPLNDPPVDQLYLAPLAGTTDQQGEFAFEAREQTFLPTNTIAEFAFLVSATVNNQLVTVTVSKPIDVFGGGIPPIQPPPQPLPPSPNNLLPLGNGPWTLQQKAAFSEGAVKMAELGQHMMLEALTLEYAGIVVPLIHKASPQLLLMEGIVGTFSYFGSHTLAAIAQDPPDPNFATVAFPELRVPEPIVIADRISASTTQLMNEHQGSKASIDAYLRALQTSVDRYFTALGANDLASAALQRNAILAYNGALVPLFQADGAITDSFRAGLQADGFPNLELTEADIVAIQQEVAANGLPTSFVEILQQLNLSPAEIQAVEEAVLNAVPADVAGTLYDLLLADAETSNAAATTFSLGLALVAVPDVNGLSQADAQAAILAAGLTVGTVTTANNGTVPAGKVISQNPAIGANVAPGSPVNLVVSSGAAPPVPGDLDRDGDIDQNDVNILLKDRNKPVAQSACGTPCDLDGNGTITNLDARKLVLLCTRPNCAMQ
jgi:TolB protein